LQCSPPSSHGLEHPPGSALPGSPGKATRNVPGSRRPGPAVPFLGCRGHGGLAVSSLNWKPSRRVRKGTGHTQEETIYFLAGASLYLHEVRKVLMK